MAAWTRSEPPLQTTIFTARVSTLDEFLHDAETGGMKYDLAAAYQRGSVWTVEQQQALVMSVLRGVPFGTVIVNKRSYDVEHNARMFGTKHLYAVVDGKQRIEALTAFCRGHFTVPADWWEDDLLGDVPDDGRVSYAHLSAKGQAVYRDTSLVTSIARVQTLAAEAAIFGLVNGTGTAQTDEDISNAARIAASQS